MKRPLYLPEDGEPTRDAIKSKKDQVEKCLNKTNTVKGTPSKLYNESQKDSFKFVNISIHDGELLSTKHMVTVRSLGLILAEPNRLDSNKVYNRNRAC